MFADAKDIETGFIRQCDRVQQFVEMPRGLDGLTGFRIDGGGYELSTPISMCNPRGATLFFHAEF